MLQYSAKINIKFILFVSSYAVFWFILSLLISCTNDILSKFLANDLHASQVIFWRFFFGTISILPFIICSTVLKTKYLKIHILRGGLLAIAIFLWNFGIQMVPISTITVMNFTIPMFTLCLAPIILKEKVSWQLWLITLIGFAGVITVFSPNLKEINGAIFIFVIASVLFAFLDILNRKLLLQKEKSMTMIFYSALFSTAFAFYPATNYWQSPDIIQLGLLAVLGIGSNLILYCLLKAFSYAKASSLAPLRYLELVFSLIAGYVLFHETPSYHTYIGTIIIVISSFIVTNFGLISYVKK